MTATAFLKGIERAAYGLVILSGGLSLVLMCHTSLDALYRYVVGRTLGATIEIASLYYMLPMSVLPLAYLTMHGQLMNVTFATEHLSVRTKRYLDLANQVVVVLVLGGLAFICFEEAVSKTREGEVWESINGLIPSWPARWVLVLAFGAAALTAAIRLFCPAQDTSGQLPH